MNSDDLSNNQSLSKVAQVMEAYGLTGLGEELEARWLNAGEERMSTRQLAEFFNIRVLESAVESSDMNLLDIDAEKIYERLTGDDVSSGLRTRMTRRLAQNGVDIEQVTDDFVSHQTIHTYLRECRGIERPTKTSEERRENALERIQKLQDRSAAVTESTIESLQREGVVPEGEIDIIVDIQVIYQDTAEQHNVYDLLD